METTLDILRSNIMKSPFNRQGYRVSVELGSLHRSLRFYSEAFSEDVADPDLINTMTPNFQRDNDKWDLSRKVKFVENILAGYPSDITLFTVKNDLLDDCGILDGLQRLTAIQDWFEDKFPIFEGIYYSQLSHLRRAPFSSCRVSFVIHKFDSLKDAIQFYIDINEGISHSEADILKAKNYLKSLEET